MNARAFALTLLGALIVALLAPFVVELDYEYGAAVTGIFMTAAFWLAVVAITINAFKRIFK